MNTPDVTVELAEHVATVEIHRPPNNFFDTTLIKGIADAYGQLDDDLECRVIVLCALKVTARQSVHYIERELRLTKTYSGVTTEPSDEPCPPVGLHGCLRRAEGLAGVTKRRGEPTA